MRNKKLAVGKSWKTCTDIMEDFVHYERRYIDKYGMHLFPVKWRDKCPITLNGFYDAVNSYEDYRELHRGQLHNVAVRTGVQSGFFVLDIDPKNGGMESYSKLLDEYGPVPPTWQSRTQSGGTHYFFRWDPTHPVHNKVKVRPGIDVRGDGGYVVLPPSMGATGNVYKWIRSPETHDLLQAPDWVYSLILDDSPPRAKDMSHLAEGAVEGRRNATLTQLVGMCLGRGFDARLTMKLAIGYNTCWVKPSLSQTELDKILYSIAKREIAKRARRNTQ